MILTISGLPKHFNYHDAKAIIKQETRISNFILDDLMMDSNGKKKITVGLADGSEAPMLMSRLNGFMILDHRLSVTPLGGGQQRGMHSDPQVLGQRGPEPPRSGPALSYSYEPPRGLAAQRPATTPYQPQPHKPVSSQNYNTYVEDKHLTSYQAPVQKLSAGLLKTPTSRDFITKPDMYSSSRKSPPRSYSPRRSPPRYAPEPKMATLGDPNFGPGRGRPPFGASQAPQSANFSSGPNTGGDERYRISSLGTEPPGASSWKQPVPEIYNDVSRTMDSRPAPFGNRSHYDRPGQESSQYGYQGGPARDIIPPRGRSPRLRSRSPQRRSPSGNWLPPRSSPPRHRDLTPPRSVRSPPRDTRSPTRIPPWEQDRRTQTQLNDRKISRSSRWEASEALEASKVPPVQPSRPSGPPKAGPVPSAQSTTWADNLPPRNFIPPRFASHSPVREGRAPPLDNSGPYNHPQTSASRRNDSDPYFESQNSNFQRVRPHNSGPREFGAREGPVDVGPKGGIRDFGPPDGQRNIGNREGSQNFGFREEPQNLHRLRDGTRGGDSRDDSRDFRPREVSRDFGPREGPRDFGPREVPRDFGPREGPRDFEPRQGPRDFGPRQGPRDFVPGEGRRDFGPREGPREFEPREGPRDFGPREGPRDFILRDQGRRDEHEFGVRGGPHFDGPRDIPRDFNPRDGPRDLESRDFRPREGPRGGMGPRDLSPRGMEPQDFGPRDTAPRDFRPRDVNMRDFEAHNIKREFGPKGGPRFEPRFSGNGTEGPRSTFSPRERPAPVAPFERSDRPPFVEEHKRVEGRNRSVGRRSDRSVSRGRTAGLPEKEMETRNAVINKISQQMIKNYKPRLHITDPQLHSDVEHELKKVILERIDSIFGIKFGNDFGSIARAYRQEHKAVFDRELMERMVSRCSAKSYVRKRSSKDVSGPPAKKPREVDAKAPSKGAPESSREIRSYSTGGGDDTVNLGEAPKEPKKETYNLYITKDDFADISIDEAMQIKTFFIDEIVKSTTISDFTPSFLINGVQNAISFEVKAENEKSKEWLQKHDLSGFKLFNILVYTLEEMSYERASILLPGYSDDQLPPLERLRLQNTHLKDVEIDKWKFVKSILTPTGTRIFVDMSKSSSQALTQHDMMLSYELEKVFVFLKSMSTDRCEFDKAFNEKSVPVKTMQGLSTIVVNSAKDGKIHNDTIRISLENQKMTIEHADLMKKLIVQKIYKYLQSEEGDSSKTVFEKHRFYAVGFLAVFPSNHQSSNWLQSQDFGEICGKNLLIEQGPYFPKFVRIGFFVPGEIGAYGPSVLENIHTSNSIQDMDVTKWKLALQELSKDETGSKIILEIDFASMKALKAAQFALKYGSQDIKIWKDYINIMNQYDKSLNEMNDHYEVADMEIDGEEDNTNNSADIGSCNENDMDIADNDSQHEANINCVNGTMKKQEDSNRVDDTHSDEPVNETAIVDSNNAINENSTAAEKTNSKDPKNTDTNKNIKNQAVNNENAITVIDEDIMIYESNPNDVIITIDSDDDDEEVARKKELESIFRSINREIEKRQKKDPLGRDLSLRALYDKCDNDAYREKYEGKFSNMPDKDLDYFHDRIIKLKPNKDRRRVYNLESFLAKIQKDIESKTWG